MAVILTTDFTNTDGSAWPSPWVSSAGTNTIQLNRGQQESPNAAWAAAVSYAGQSLGNGTLYVTARTPSITNQSMRIDFRYDNGAGNGYRLIIGLSYSGFELARVDAFADTVIASNNTTAWAADTNYRIAVDFNGTTLRAKRWQVDTETEPVSWELSVADATYTTGDIGLRVQSEATAAAVTGLWDDVSLSDYVDTTAPVVSLANPTPSGQTAGYEHISGTTVLSATATDDVAVSSVAFYDGDPAGGGTLLATVAASPYEYSWDTTLVANGMHALYAVATDSSSNTATSAKVDVMVNNSGVWVPKGARAWPVTVKTN